MGAKVGDGFDHYNTTTDFLARTGFLQWQFPNVDPPSIFQFVPGLTGYGKALQLGSHQNIGEQSHITRAVWAARNQEMYIGIRLNVLTGYSTSFSFGDSLAGGQVAVSFNKDNFTVSASRGNTSIGVSPNNVWQGSTQNWIEFHIKIHPSSGIVEVRNQTNVIFSFTGNTQNTANAWSDIMDILPFVNGQIGVTPSCIIDDLYYVDTTTDPGLLPNNTYLGDMRVATLFAVGNNTVQWTPLTATNWVEISEQAMDSDVSYNYSATPGQQDLFNYSAVESLLDIFFAVQITGAYRKDDAGVRTIKQAMKSGATTAYGVNWNVPDNVYSYFTDLFVLDPNTTANWTLTAVNSLAAGYNLVA